MQGECIDAEFASYHPWNVPDIDFFQKNLGSFPLSPQQQALYRYQIDIDGVTAAFTALPWKMLTGSLVFKQKSDHIMWFHHALVPGKHYVEVDSNLHNVIEMLNWAREHDQQAQEIAANGREFVSQYLDPDTILEYCYLVLLQYAQLQM